MIFEGRRDMIFSKHYYREHKHKCLEKIVIFFWG